MPYTPYTQEKTVFLLPDKIENSPCMKISLNLLEIAGNDGLRDCTYRVLYKNSPPAMYGDNLIAALEEQYAAAADVWAESDPAASFSWEYSETVEASDLERVMQIKRTRYEFAGGAHGIQTEEFFVFDKTGKDGKTPNDVSLSDIILPDAQTALLRIIEARLRMDAGLSVDASLSENGFFDDAVETPSQFFIAWESAPSGIGFHWNPYEIAPYARGYVETVVPYEEIQNMLTDYGKDLLRQ
ncbi:MAG: RsiV family protein [Treponema sp.]|nr:RsiV family protein [Treponema sp.]